MKKEIFVSILKEKSLDRSLFELLPSVLSDTSYHDGDLEPLLKNQLFNRFNYDNSRMFSDVSMFETFSFIFDVLAPVSLGEKDNKHLSVIFSRYIEKGLVLLQDSNNPVLNDSFLKTLEKNIEKYPSKNALECFEKAKERLNTPLLLGDNSEKEEDVAALEIKSVSKLKNSDIDFILNNKERYSSEAIYKFVKMMLKKDKESVLLRNGFSPLDILKIKVDLLNKGDIESLSLTIQHEHYLKDEDFISFFYENKSEIIDILDSIEGSIPNFEKNLFLNQFGDRFSKHSPTNTDLTIFYEMLLDVISNHLDRVVDIRQLVFSDKRLLNSNFNSLILIQIDDEDFIKNYLNVSRDYSINKIVSNASSSISFKATMLFDFAETFIVENRKNIILTDSLSTKMISVLEKLIKIHEDFKIFSEKNMSKLDSYLHHMPFGSLSTFLAFKELIEPNKFEQTHVFPSFYKDLLDEMPEKDERHYLKAFDFIAKISGEPLERLHEIFGFVNTYDTLVYYTKNVYPEIFNDFKVFYESDKEGLSEALKIFHETYKFKIS